MPQQIVLVGLPGSGKSTVGPLLAQRLGWQFIDFDPLIEAEAGLPIREIFAQFDETEFRRLESELTARLASTTHTVLAPGGGWILRNTLPAAVMVWLQVDPAEAVQRMGDDVGARPLLLGDPLDGIRQLLDERIAHYQRAALHINTNGQTPGAVAEAIATAIEKNGNEEKS